jgi:hypothetical protein
MVCPLLQPIVHPDQGGPTSNAPPYDCSRKASAAPEGNNYKFDAAGLANGQVVAVAILPTGPVDRVVLNAPDDASLATQQGSADASPAPVDDSVAAPTDAGSAPTGDLSTSTAPIGGDSTAPFSLPGGTGDASSSVAPTPAAVPPATAGASSAGAFVPAVSTGPEKATPLLVILLIAGAVGAAALWLYAGSQRPAGIA